MKYFSKPLPPTPPRVKPPRDQLLVNDGLTMTTQKKHAFPEMLVRLLITLCGSIGTIGVLQGFFKFPIQLKPLFLFTVVLSIIMRSVRLISPKVGFGSILTAFASIPLLLMKFREPAVVGAGEIYHIMRRRILWRMSFPPNDTHAVGWTDGQCVQLVFYLIIIALVALMEYSDVLLTHPQSSRSGFWIRFLVTFPFLECGLYFGIETYSICVFLLAIFCSGRSPFRDAEPRLRLWQSRGAPHRFSRRFPPRQSSGSPRMSPALLRCCSRCWHWQASRCMPRTITRAQPISIRSAMISAISTRISRLTMSRDCSRAFRVPWASMSSRMRLICLIKAICILTADRCCI